MSNQPHSSLPAEVIPVHWGSLSTRLGSIFVATTPDGVVSVSTGSGTDAAFLAELEAALGVGFIAQATSSPLLDRALDELDAYFAGRLLEFGVSLDWRLLHGAFNLRVLEALRAVPWGQLVSYSELGRRVGAPRAARAVGRACGANPLPILVPCHRVVRADGTIGGYGDAGVYYKQSLLALEQVAFDIAPRLPADVAKSTYRP